MSQATRPAGLQDTRSEKKSNAKRTSAQQQQSHGMPVTSAVTAPYSGTSNQTQIANTHSIPDADPSMLSNTQTYTARHTKYTTPALENSASFPLSPVPLSSSDSLFLISHLNSPYLASQLNMEKIGHRHPLKIFQVNAHNVPADGM